MHQKRTKRTPEQKAIDAEVEQALRELEAAGLVRWNGEYRNGQRVYVSTQLPHGNA